jgi:hypothetical protein
LASRLKSACKIADGALNPEFEVGEVNATFLPLRFLSAAAPRPAVVAVPLASPTRPSASSARLRASR